MWKENGLFLDLVLEYRQAGILYYYTAINRIADHCPR